MKKIILVILCYLLLPKSIGAQIYAFPEEDPSNMTSFTTTGRLTSENRIVQYRKGLKIIGVRALLRHTGGYNYTGIEITLGRPGYVYTATFRGDNPKADTLFSWVVWMIPDSSIEKVNAVFRGGKEFVIGFSFSPFPIDIGWNGEEPMFGFIALLPPKPPELIVSNVDTSTFNIADSWLINIATEFEVNPNGENDIETKFVDIFTQTKIDSNYYEHPFEGTNELLTIQWNHQIILPAHIVFSFRSVNPEDSFLKSEWVDYEIKYDQPPPKKFSMVPLYPNPFRINYYYRSGVVNHATITVNLPESQNITLTIYNILGQIIDQIVYSGLDIGHQRLIRWDGRDSNDNFLPSGIYLYQLSTANWQSPVNKVTVIK